MQYGPKIHDTLFLGYKMQILYKNSGKTHNYALIAC